MFKGFDIKYPEYEVITPQTGYSINVRSLNVSEEERLKASLVTPSKITEHLNKCIYEAITKKPAPIKDFDSFLKNITLRDREALLYGLYHITYEEIRNYDVRCGNCNREYPVTIQASSTFSANPYPEKDILTKRIKIELPVAKGISAYLKQPVLLDEIQALKSLSAYPGANITIITETLIIDKFEQDVEEQTTPNVFDDRQDIIDAYMSLPSRDKRFIYDRWLEEFGKYGIELKMQTNCPNCNNEEVIDIDLAESFFRMVYGAR